MKEDFHMETNSRAIFLLIFVTAYSLLGISGCSKNSPKTLASHKKRNSERSSDEINEKYENQPRALKKELARLVKRSPTDVDLKFKLAEACKKKGDYQEAADLYKMCSTLAFNKEGVTDMLSEKELAEKQEYARYNEVYCQHQATNYIKDECDLSCLENVIKKCDSFSRDFPYSNNLENITEIKLHCRSRLLQKIQSTFDYYCENWYTKSKDSSEIKFANSDKIAAEKILEKMQRDFNVEDSDIAPKIAFSKFKLAKIEYQITKKRKLDALHKSRAEEQKNSMLAKIKGEDTNKSGSSSYQDFMKSLEIEQAAKDNLLAHLNILNDNFADSKELKSAQAITQYILV